MKSIALKLFSNKTIERFKKKNMALGVNNKTTYVSDLSLYFLVIVIALVVSIVFCYHKFYLILILPIAAALLFEFMYYDVRLAKRKDLLNKEALFFFQILSLTLESGNNLKNSIDLTCKNMDNELSREFKKAMDDMTLGKSLNESLDDLKTRIPS